MFGTLEIHSSSEEQTIRMAETIGRMLEPGDVILLTGDLGSGKTRIAKGIVSAATGVPADEVVSPTFTLINRFGDDFPVHHADLYRIDANSLMEIGLEDALEEEGALVIEWAEKVRDLFENPLEIEIMYAESEDERNIVIRWSRNSSWDGRLTRLCDLVPCAHRRDVPPAADANASEWR
jgi:tRNA threonylcarbamoyladenosine biosynthesis protein TsaE